MSEKNTAVMDLTQGPVAKTLIRFSLPFMVSTLLQTLYSTVDTVVVGQALGSAGLSAVSNGSQLMQLLYMVCVGFATASQILIAQYKGAGNAKRVQECVGTVFYIITIMSLGLGVICMIFSGQFLTWLSTPKEAFDAARSYILICGGGMIFTGFYNMFSAILRGMGDSRHPLIFVAIASVINLILDVIFIVWFHWGVAGAAWATIIGQAASVVFSFVYLSRHSEEIGFRFRIRSLRYDRATGATNIKLGIPMAIQSAAISVSFLFVSALINALGVSVSAAFGVAQKLRNLPGILTQGLGLGCSSMMGQNLGAGKQDRVRQTVWWGILISTIINAAFCAFFLASPELSFRMFTQDETVLAFATLSIVTMCIEAPGKCLMTSCNALVSAQGFVAFSMAVAFTDAFAGRVFLCWFLGKYLNMGVYGYFLGYNLATYLTAIPNFVYFISGWWKKRATLAK